MCQNILGQLVVMAFHNNLNVYDDIRRCWEKHEELLPRWECYPKMSEGEKEIAIGLGVFQDIWELLKSSLDR